MNIKANLQLDMPSGPKTMKDVVNWIEVQQSYAPATAKDYISQVRRCVVIFNVNDLEAVSADLDKFREQFDRQTYLVEEFKSFTAYLAWRKKVISVLKAFWGILERERQSRCSADDWSDAIAEFKSHNALRNSQTISIGVLAAEARAAGLPLKEMQVSWLKELAQELPPNRARSVLKATQYLEEARAVSSKIAQLLPEKCIRVTYSARRTSQDVIPSAILEESDQAIQKISEGDYDPILDEFNRSNRPGTVNTYRAARSKYLNTAYSENMLDREASSLVDAFHDEIFRKVLRHWIHETDDTRKISDRTKRKYVANLIAIAEQIGAPTELMKQALNGNRNMRQGAVDGKVMPQETKEFCARLLRDRKMCLKFLSLNVAFYKKARLLSNHSDLCGPSEHKLIELGTLAVLSSIALWGVPLRLNNLRSLRHIGPEPTLILPSGSRDAAQIILARKDVKNRKPIRASIPRSGTRALEIIEWYLAEIRPRFAMAGRSNYLFPGFKSEMIAAGTLRNWLYRQTREMGIPMKPHNFRHGLATLYLRDNPSGFSYAAQLLGNSASVVRQHYAWIDHDKELAEVQQEVAKLAGVKYGTQ